MPHYGEGWHLLQATQQEGAWENARMWIVVSIVLTSGGTSLADGVHALSAFEFDAAVRHLEAARNEGPYSYDRHVELYEKLGIAYASVDRKADAVAAFEQLLALDPGHAIPYTLAPKVTFVFDGATTGERAAGARRSRRPRGSCKLTHTNGRRTRFSGLSRTHRPSSLTRRSRSTT